MDPITTPDVPNPMSDTSDSHQLAFLAARAFSASRRPLVGSDLDDTDKAVLLDVAALLDTSGRGVEYFMSRGQRGQAPNEAVASRLDVTVDAVIDSHPDESSVQEALEAIAGAIRAFVDAPVDDMAEELSTFFAFLGRAAARQTESPGEIVIAV